MSYQRNKLTSTMGNNFSTRLKVKRKAKKSKISDYEKFHFQFLVRAHEKSMIELATLLGIEEPTKQTIEDMQTPAIENCDAENSVKLETLSDLERYFDGNSSSSRTMTEIDQEPAKRTTVQMLNAAIEDHNKENSVKLETLSDLERYFNENSSSLSKIDQSPSNETIENMLTSAIEDGNVEKLQELIDQGANLNYPCDDEFYPLLVACCFGKGDVETVKILVENGAELESLDKFNATPLMHAVLNNYVEIVDYLISKGANVNHEVPQSTWPALCHAIFDGNLILAKILIKHGANVNAQFYGRPVLCVALQRNYFDIADLLLEKGAEIDFIDSQSFTPLLHTIHKGHVEIVEYLASMGANVNLEIPVKKWTPLGNAVCHGHLEIVKILIDYGASPNRPFKDKPLVYFAVKYGYTDVLKYLLESGARLTVSYQYEGEPLIHLALKNGHFEVAKCLVENNYPIESLDKHYTTPLMQAVKSGDVEIVEFLISQGAKVNYKNPFNKRTALGIASSIGQIEIAKILIKHGASIQSQNIKMAIFNEHYDLAKFLISKGGPYESDVLYKILFEKGHFEIVEYLARIEANSHLQRCDVYNELFEHCLNGKKWSQSEAIGITNFLLRNGFDVNSNHHHERPLARAVFAGQIGIARQLIENGADLNWQYPEDGNGTPLHIAIMVENLEMCRLLLENGANLEIRNPSNETPLDMAKELGMDQVIDLIIENMITEKSENSNQDTAHSNCLKMDECVICYSSRKEIYVFHPCGHAKTCQRCSLKILHKSEGNPTCPVCRTQITDYMKVYL